LHESDCTYDQGNGNPPCAIKFAQHTEGCGTTAIVPYKQKSTRVFYASGINFQNIPGVLGGIFRHHREKGDSTMKLLLFLLPFLLFPGCTVAEIEAPIIETQALEIVAYEPEVKVAAHKETDGDKWTSHPPVKTAYITIDDGPSLTVTPQILDILAEQDVRATFFVLPYADTDTLYQRIRDEGHAVGNHSYSHDYNRLYANDNGDFFRDDVLRAEEFLKEKFGARPTLFRFPGGSASWRRDVIARRVEILGELGYRYFDWDVSNGDTAPAPESRDPNVLAANVMARADGREQLIVLMHDSVNKTPTAEALPEVIAGLRALGYRFDTLENYVGE